MSKFKVGDRVKIIRGSGCSTGFENCEGTVTRIDDSNIGWCEIQLYNGILVVQNSQYGDITEIIINNKTTKTIMSNIVTFAKNLVLTADEKLLRKHGLKDSNGQYTSDAFDLVDEKLAKENEDYLIEIAKAKEAEEVKK